MYDRLKFYLTTLDIPYMLARPSKGCAITLEAAGASASQMMHHVGWASPAMPRYYARVDRVADGQAAKKLAGMTIQAIQTTATPTRSLKAWTMASCL